MATVTETQKLIQPQENQCINVDRECQSNNQNFDRPLVKRRSEESIENLDNRAPKHTKSKLQDPIQEDEENEEIIVVDDLFRPYKLDEKTSRKRNRQLTQTSSSFSNESLSSTELSPTISPQPLGAPQKGSIPSSSLSEQNLSSPGNKSPREKLLKRKNTQATRSQLQSSTQLRQSQCSPALEQVQNAILQRGIQMQAMPWMIAANQQQRLVWPPNYASPQFIQPPPPQHVLPNQTSMYPIMQPPMQQPYYLPQPQPQHFMMPTPQFYYLSPQQARNSATYYSPLLSQQPLISLPAPYSYPTMPRTRNNTNRR